MKYIALSLLKVCVYLVIYFYKDPTILYVQPRFCWPHRPCTDNNNTPIYEVAPDPQEKEESNNKQRQKNNMNPCLEEIQFEICCYTQLDNLSLRDQKNTKIAPKWKIAPSSFLLLVSWRNIWQNSALPPHRLLQPVSKSIHFFCFFLSTKRIV